MRIEHVALYVNDLENTKKFFVKYLGQNQMMDITIRKQAFVLIFLHLMMVHVLKSRTYRKWLIYRRNQLVLDIHI